MKKDDQAGSTPSPKLKVPIKEHENSDCASSTEEQLRLKISELKRNSFVGENLTKVSIQSWYLLCRCNLRSLMMTGLDVSKRFHQIIMQRINKCTLSIVILDAAGNAIHHFGSIVKTEQRLDSIETHCQSNSSITVSVLLTLFSNAQTLFAA